MARNRSRIAGNRGLDLSEFREALKDNRVWTGIAVVKPSAGQDSYFEILTNANGDRIDVLVDVVLMPYGEEVTCRLASWGGCAGGGAWRIPPIGTEVVIMIPQGQLEADPMIVGTLSTNTVPSQLDDSTWVLTNPGRVYIEATNGDTDLRASGTVNVGGTDQPIPLGTSLENRLAALEAIYNDHVHISAGSGAPSSKSKSSQSGNPDTAFSGLPKFQATKGKVS